MLAGTKRTSTEKELNKIYRILLDSQERLIKLKGITIFKFYFLRHPTCTSLPLSLPSSSLSHVHIDEASKSTRSSTTDELVQQDSSVLISALPVRLQTICELIVIIKNLELASKSLLLKRTLRLGSK